MPGPRGGQWNASTIRGDPKKLVGILNNPLYVGRLVWGRRQWRRNPDSEQRERLYRLLDRSEWVEVAAPDFRIVDNALWEGVRTELERRKRQSPSTSPVASKRSRHMLSSLIKCSSCGSNYTISGKDYYRCAGQKERGTCGNKVSVRKEPLETATLAILQSHLLTEDHTRLFVAEFRREAALLAKGAEHRDTVAEARLTQVEIELGNLYQNLLAGLASPVLQNMITEREAEKERLTTQLTLTGKPRPTADILPHPVLLERFQEKVAMLRTSLDDDAVRTEASSILATLIESVTIYPGT